MSTSSSRQWLRNWLCIWLCSWLCCWLCSWLWEPRYTGDRSWVLQSGRRLSQEVVRGDPEDLRTYYYYMDSWLGEDGPSPAFRGLADATPIPTEAQTGYR